MLPSLNHRVTAVAQEPEHYLQHEPPRGMLGQHGDGELLLDVENRALRSYGDRTREQARADVFDYIERFYNPFRKHPKLNYLSPVQFEERQRLKG